MTRLWITHRFLADRWFYPLLLSTALAVAVFAGRVYVTGSRTFSNLLWNLALAWVPYVCALWAVAAHRRGWRFMLAFPGLLWLVFLPNAPYLVTDFVHLRSHDGARWWIDLGLLLSFAWAGCFLAVASLHVVHGFVTVRAGRVAGWTVVLFSAGLSGFGVYMGRFLGWNSWDLFVRPGHVLADVASHARDPTADPQALAFSTFFAAFVFVCYTMFAVAARARRA